MRYPQVFTNLLLTVVTGLGPSQVNYDVRDAYLAGYLIIPTGARVDRSYNAGFSMYVAVWPLESVYPGHRFQTGLPGTWMFAQYDGPAPKDMYSDVEGGLGWWTDTRFPTETPKFIMGGVGPNFSQIANGPGHGAGSWENPRGLYGVAQLSPWLLFPPDGLNLRQGTCGQLFGYGYLNLPLCDPKPSTDGAHVPTGENSWTLFFSARNFKGPVAFFLPYYWSHAAAKEPRLSGQLLDTRPSDPNRSVQMETQYIPCRIAADSQGELYARIEPSRFPLNATGESALVHLNTCYGRSALYDSVAAWFRGGSPSSGKIELRGAAVSDFPGGGYATWEIRLTQADGKQRKVPLAWNSFATPTALDAHTYGYRWDPRQTSREGGLVTLPQYFHLENRADVKKARWVPVGVSGVPAETRLQDVSWHRPDEKPQPPYVTPDDPMSCWKRPGPKAGPFKARLGDGTVVTYYWFRFADQPALLNAGLTQEERESIQRRVEKLHRGWTKEREYLPLPGRGNLADIDPALIVKPPKGLEAGYVPIATRQELTAGNRSSLASTKRNLNLP